MQCYNRGTDGRSMMMMMMMMMMMLMMVMSRSIQWECKSEMDNSFRFGQVEVVCEGYDYPGDPYILLGSCGLEYHLELTKEGRERRGDWQEPSNSKTYYDTGHQGSSMGFVISIFFFFFISIFIFIIGTVIYAVYKAPSTEDGQAGSSPGGGEGIGGGGWTMPEKKNEANEGCHGEARHRGKKRSSKDRRDRTSASRENSPTSSGTRTASGFGGTRVR